MSLIQGICISPPQEANFQPRPLLFHLFGSIWPSFILIKTNIYIYIQCIHVCIYIYLSGWVVVDVWLASTGALSRWPSRILTSWIQLGTWGSFLTYRAQLCHAHQPTHSHLLLPASPVACGHSLSHYAASSMPLLPVGWTNAFRSWWVCLYI